MERQDNPREKTAAIRRRSVTAWTAQQPGDPFADTIPVRAASNQDEQGLWRGSFAASSSRHSSSKGTSRVQGEFQLPRPPVQLEQSCGEAATQFYHAARRFAFLPLSPNTPRLLTLDSASTKYSPIPTLSPRKLLWPRDQKEATAAGLQTDKAQPKRQHGNNFAVYTSNADQSPTKRARSHVIRNNRVSPIAVGLKGEQFAWPLTGSPRTKSSVLSTRSTAAHDVAQSETASSPETLIQPTKINPVDLIEPRSQEKPDELSDKQPTATATAHTIAETTDALPAAGFHELNAEKIYPSKSPGESKARYTSAYRLPAWQIRGYRMIFGVFVVAVNVSLLLAYLNTERHVYLLVILTFMKSKDLLSTIADVFGLSAYALHSLFHSPVRVPQKSILSLVCAYAETEEQIMKTVTSLAQQELDLHRQVVCIILDGKNTDILPRFARITHKMTRSYFTWKGSSGELTIYAGFIDASPTLLIKKAFNAGKKDSLILGHDLFNHPREDIAYETKKLRHEIFKHVIPALLDSEEEFHGFDYVFCTDADSTIHQNALQRLANALSRKQSAIAACGVLVAELSTHKLEWTMWHLYQQFQYTFGQYVRRQAEGLWGRVTCLPGCITMVKVRPESGAAISQYARPVTSHYNLLEHQVQYLGTDRRLTYCLLSQGTHLTSLFVSDALCETVVPESMEHYLSQRRRWASNAYFNDYYYACGANQFLITRLFAVIDIVRQTLVFYRVINTGLFIRSLALRFYILKIVPTLIVTKTPATWFMLFALAREPVLRKRMHKLILGMCINQVLSPVLSVIVFANVLLNMGSQVWGKTGASGHGLPPTTPSVTFAGHRPSTWSPERLATIVRDAIHGSNSGPRTRTRAPATRPNQRANVSRGPQAQPLPVTPGPSRSMAADTSGLRLRTPNSAAGI